MAKKSDSAAPGAVGTAPGAVGTWQAVSSDPRFALSGEMVHPLSHQEALDAAAVEHGCAIPSELTVTFDEAGTAMRNSPVSA